MRRTKTRSSGAILANLWLSLGIGDVGDGDLIGCWPRGGVELSMKISFGCGFPDLAEKETRLVPSGASHDFAVDESADVSGDASVPEAIVTVSKSKYLPCISTLSNAVGNHAGHVGIP